MSMDNLAKAQLSTQNTGENLVPQEIAPGIIDLQRKINAVDKFITRVAWDSDVFTFKPRTANSNASGYAESDTWNVVSSTYGSSNVTMKTLGTLGGVSNKLQAGTKAFTNAYVDEIASAARGAAKLEEHWILNGTGGGDGSFLGVQGQLTSNVFGSASSPTQISASLLDQMHDSVKERGFAIDKDRCAWIVTPKIGTQIARLTSPYSRQDNAPLALMGGFEATGWRGIKIAESSAAEQVVKVTGEAVTITSKVGTLAHNYAVVAASYDDQLGNLYNSGSAAVAPVVHEVGIGVVDPSLYTVAQNNDTGATTITFTSAPSGAITVDYFYKQQGIFLLDFSTMVMPYTLDGFSAVVGAPWQMEEMPPQPYSDSRMFRLKAYEALAVQAELGNAFCLEVYGAAYPAV